jgi:hypothetical protein
MSLGQFSKCGPAVVHGRIRPLFQGEKHLDISDLSKSFYVVIFIVPGVGWSMAAISLMVSIYYNVSFQ